MISPFNGQRPSAPGPSLPACYKLTAFVLAVVMAIIRRQGRLLLARKRVEKAQHLASKASVGWLASSRHSRRRPACMLTASPPLLFWWCQMIAKAWHNAMDIRWPINRRADARQRRNAIKAAHYHARVIQVTV